MDPFHERLARVALDVAGSFGFALAGGYAVQAHGFLNRASSDVDLFAEASAESDFPQAVDVIIAAYLREGLQVSTELRSSSFARLDVSSAADSAKVELGLDWRRNKPIQLAVGPVLHADDAVANKVCALFGRAEVRDYIDVDAILASGRYTEAQLLDLAAEHDPGFDRLRFADALAAIGRLPDSLFQPYGLSPEDTSALAGGCVHGPGDPHCRIGKAPRWAHSRSASTPQPVNIREQLIFRPVPGPLVSLWLVVTGWPSTP